MDESSPQQQMARMLSGYWISQSLYVVAKLGIADLVKDAPRDAASLAEATGMHPRSLYRLLRTLASVGVFAESDDGRFGLTPLAECLRDDTPGSQRPMALMMGEEQYRAWGGLLESVRTGRSAFETIYGQPIFDYMAEQPDQARLFDRAMTSIHGRETAAVLASFDFSGIAHLADVGGGNGSTLIEILTQFPTIKGTLFDLPGVATRARMAIEAAGLSARCEAVAGSFFESVPSGADAYLLRHIIHDWDDEKSTAILRSVHRAMGSGSKLLVVESVIEPGNAPSFGKLLDLAMLVVPGGMERTADEYRELFRASGFRLSKVVPTTADVSVIEGVKLP